MDNQNIRIRLRGYDNSLLDTSTQDIINTATALGDQANTSVNVEINRSSITEGGDASATGDTGGGSDSGASSGGSGY